MSMAERIQNLRKAKGVSQEELAEVAGVSRQAVSKWESEQSLPEIDKVLLIAEYFGVTTDYLLKGEDAPAQEVKKENGLSSRVLYIAATAFTAIGLFTAFGAWYEEQNVTVIWGAMVIQAIGVAGYFIGKLLSSARAPKSVDWLNILLCAFMPVCMLTQWALGRVISPYPTDLVGAAAFLVAFAAVAGVAWWGLGKRKK